jgi:hypothetical protein
MVTNVNRKNAKIRMEASSAGKIEYRGKGRSGHVWATGFHHVTALSCLAHVLKLMDHLFI